MPDIDRRRVKASFSGQARHYDESVRVQKRVIDRLLDLIPPGEPPPRTILDIGAGTGMLLGRLAERYPRSWPIGADLAFGMARAAQQAQPTIPILTADAEQLPFRTATFDLVVSTSTFQWLTSLDRAFTEAFRVLKPGHPFVFALFGAGTLQELNCAFRTALAGSDQIFPDRSHRFFACTEVTAALRGCGFPEGSTWCETEVEYYPDVPTLLRTLKRIGAGSASPKPLPGLAGRSIMTRMVEAYRSGFADERGIPATYGVIYGVAIKPAGC